MLCFLLDKSVIGVYNQDVLWAGLNIPRPPFQLHPKNNNSEKEIEGEYRPDNYKYPNVDCFIASSQELCEVSKQNYTKLKNVINSWTTTVSQSRQSF